jgi:hypothetical protein
MGILNFGKSNSGGKIEGVLIKNLMSNVLSFRNVIRYTIQNDKSVSW